MPGLMTAQRLPASLLLLVAACTPEPLPRMVEPPGPTVRQISLAEAGLDAAAMDRSVDPCSDFYRFACGGWEQATTIPADQPRWNRSFSEIHKRNEEDLRAILEDAAKGPAGDAGVAKLGDFYAACMDEAGIETAGLAAVQPLWDLAGRVSGRAKPPPIEAPPEPKPKGQGKPQPKGKPQLDAKPAPPPELTVPIEAALGAFHAAGVYAFFDVDSGQDFKDATKMIAQVDQNGLGLPDRDYYLDPSPERQEIRAFYLAHVAKMLAMGGYSEAEAKVAADDVLRVETELARLSKTREERRDPKGMYNRIDREGLRQRSSGFVWDDYWRERNLDFVAQVNVSSVPYVEGIDALLGTLLPGELRHYLQWHVLHAFAAQLPARFADEDFLLDKQLSGQAEQRPRWKRCVEAADESLGELLAQSFVKKRFGPESRAAVQKMVADISAAFRREVGRLSWMNDPTRDRAQEKLDKMAYLIGYPDQWKAYEFDVARAKHAENIVAARTFEIRRSLAKIGKPVDRGEWYMTPPTVNAYYTALKNQMVFPAGILQPPFFQPEAILAVNLGGIGMVVGHELTHGFDDQGSQFDGNGNLEDWWEPEVRKSFSERTACMVAQYDGYEALPGVHLKGKMTLGENIADAGGVTLAFQGYLLGRENPAEVFVADGFSEDQMFFLSVGQIWCSKYREAFAKLRAATDYHSQPNWRVNGSLANSPEFAKAFQCAAGTPMHPKKSCAVW
jgi:putative endopeptidase